jgi:serine/threonine-protein kinase
MGGSTAPRPLAAGDVVDDKYVVERTIGMGGMGQVVGARHRELGTRVAIKVVHSDRLNDQTTLTRFKLEAQALAKLTSEHTVRIYDVGETAEGLPFIIMEYLEGADLGSLLFKEHPLAIADILEWMIQASSALGEAHAVGIIHRDLKPGNLFLSKRASGEGLVRVLDFGLAKSMKKEVKTVTAMGEVVGTSSYMAPEQLRRLDLDARTDIWGAGACLHRLLTREFPFGADLPEMCLRILSEPPTPARSVRPDVPASVEAIVARCLQKNPGARFQSMSELAAALREARDGLGRSLGTVRMPSAPPPAMPTVPGIHRTVPLEAKVSAPPRPISQPPPPIAPIIPPVPARPIPPAKSSRTLVIGAVAAFVVTLAGVAAIALGRSAPSAPPSIASSVTPSATEPPAASSAPEVVNPPAPKAVKRIGPSRPQQTR